MEDRSLTFKFELRGGQRRLRQMILYVADRCADAPRFGRIKLNKVLWKSDFEAFAARGVPVTGCAYQRLRLGPAPKAMRPLYDEMLRQGDLTEQITDFGEFDERRPRAMVEADLSLFDASDLAFVDDAIRYYWHLTGMETSDDSHGIAWQTRADNDPMPYEAALLSSRLPSGAQLGRIRDRIRDQALQSE